MYYSIIYMYLVFTLFPMEHFRYVLILFHMLLNLSHPLCTTLPYLKPSVSYHLWWYYKQTLKSRTVNPSQHCHSSFQDSEDEKLRLTCHECLRQCWCWGWKAHATLTLRSVAEHLLHNPQHNCSKLFCGLVAGRSSLQYSQSVSKNKNIKN